MTENQSAGIGEFKVVAIDAEDAEGLAQFYAKLTGLQVDRSRSDDEWINLGDSAGVLIAIQKVEKHVPPNWPDAQNGQQLHLDIYVPDLDAARAQVEEIGAQIVEAGHGDGFQVYLDPAGHPFCLCVA